ncbi:hypothetical protein, partial [Nocardia nova]|uniref:hypothetical protein n=1 Tax=Nocardia nova TaxID=37330 RepID=UPI000D434EB2
DTAHFDGPGSPDGGCGGESGRSSLVIAYRARLVEMRCVVVAVDIDRAPVRAVNRIGEPL